MKSRKTAGSFILFLRLCDLFVRGITSNLLGSMRAKGGPATGMSESVAEPYSVQANRYVVRSVHRSAHSDVIGVLNIVLLVSVILNFFLLLLARAKAALVHHCMHVAIHNEHKPLWTKRLSKRPIYQ